MTTRVRARPDRITVVLEHASIGGGTLVAVHLLSRWAAEGIMTGTIVLESVNPAMAKDLGAHGPLQVLAVTGHRRRAIALRRALRQSSPSELVFAVGDYCALLAVAATGMLPRSRRPMVVIGEHQPRPLVAAIRASRGPVVAAAAAGLEALLRRETAGSVFTEAGQGPASAAWRRSSRPGIAIPNPSSTIAATPEIVAERADRMRSAGPIRLIAVGALNPQKDHVSLVEAMRLLDERFTLTVVGQGEIDVAEICAQPPAVSDRVTVLGARDDVESLLDAHDVLVLSSRWETAYPLVVVEAVTRGLPVVGTECSPAMRSLADRVGTVRLVPVSDPAALAAAIIATSAAPPASGDLLTAAHELGTVHDPDRAARAHLDFFATLGRP